MFNNRFSINRGLHPTYDEETDNKKVPEDNKWNVEPRYQQHPIQPLNSTYYKKYTRMSCPSIEDNRSGTLPWLTFATSCNQPAPKVTTVLYTIYVLTQTTSSSLSIAFLKLTLKPKHLHSFPKVEDFSHNLFCTLSWLKLNFFGYKSAKEL